MALKVFSRYYGTDKISTKFRDNYTAVKQPANNKKGYKTVFVYNNDYYVWKNGPEYTKKVQKFSLIYVLAIAVLYFVASFLRADVNLHDAVAIPALCALVPIAFMLYSLTQLFRIPKDGRMTAILFKDLHIRYRTFVFVNILFLLCAVGGCVYRFIVAPISGLSVFVAVSYLCCGVMSILLYNILKKLKYEIVENKDKKEVL